jgi:hypothetical protein
VAGDVVGALIDRLDREKDDMHVFAGDLLEQLSRFLCRHEQLVAVNLHFVIGRRGSFRARRRTF